MVASVLLAVDTSLSSPANHVPPSAKSSALKVSKESGRCHRNCLCSSCLKVARFPLYSYACKGNAKTKRVRSSGDLYKMVDMADLSVVADESSTDDWSCSDSDTSSVWGQAETALDNLIISQWEERAERGLYRYDVTKCDTKVLEGEYGFVAQLNEGRHLKKRQTEFKIDQVLQDFDPKRFNFTKIGQEEVLFRFEEASDNYSTFVEQSSTMCESSPTLVVINVSPIEYGHVLIVPRVADCIPQRLDKESFLVALNFAIETDNPFFRLGYNSLGAFATINHLHFQAYFLPKPFAVEMAPTVTIQSSTTARTLLSRNAHGGGGGGCQLSVLANYPVRGFVFELGESLDELATIVAGTCKRLENQNVPFNILIAERGHRVFLYPQCFAARQASNEVDEDLLQTQVNPAVWEISGHIVLKRLQDYENATESFAWKLLEQVSLDEKQFENVKQICLQQMDSWQAV